jgi:hypothetical protein
MSEFGDTYGPSAVVAGRRRGGTRSSHRRGMGARGPLTIYGDAKPFAPCSAKGCRPSSGVTAPASYLRQGIPAG